MSSFQMLGVRVERIVFSLIGRGDVLDLVWVVSSVFLHEHQGSIRVLNLGFGFKGAPPPFTLPLQKHRGGMGKGG